MKRVTPIDIVALLMYAPLALRHLTKPEWWRISKTRLAVERYATAAPLSVRGWGPIWIASCVLGLVVYLMSLLWVYSGIQTALRNAAPTEVAFLGPASNEVACTGSDKQPTQLAKWYGAAFGISDSKVLLQLSAALCMGEIGKKVPVAALPALTVVENYLKQDSQCGGNGQCGADCSSYWRRRMARLLGGSPRSGTAELALAPQPAVPVTSGSPSGKGPGCDIADPSPWWNFGGLIAKPSPISAPDVAKWLLRTQNCVDSNKEACQLVTRLLQAALDNPKVRWERTFVNMLWGWERLVVLILFFVVLLCLAHRSLARQNLDRQKRELMQWYRNALSRRLPTDKFPTQRELAEAWLLQFKNAGDAFKHSHPEEQDNPLFSPIRNLLRVPEKDEIEIRARIDKELIAQSRVTLDALITIFPVIGFVATLWGLIVALSSANLIASSTGDDRNAAVMHVTSELSSCFSTTLLALVFMTFFAIWNTLQGRREQELVSDTQDCLLSGGANAAHFLKYSGESQGVAR